MRLKKSKNAAEEQLIALTNEGYRILSWLQSDYREKRNQKTFNAETDHKRYEEPVNEWGDKVIDALNTIFPTEMEANLFLNPPHTFKTVSADNHDEYKVKGLHLRVIDLLHGLDKIISDNLGRYTDLPLESRIYVEDIDSFHKVRDVNPAVVAHLLKDVRIELSEDIVQLGLEQILDVSFHKKDWGGETNDLYTANVVLNGARIATAFVLKGNGLKKKMMEIADCGKNGDQLVRLFDSPAQLFIIQFVGEVSEAVIKDAEGKIAALRSHGKSACFCIINGQDTARLLHAYGKL
jgi:hypothetical protein